MKLNIRGNKIKVTESIETYIEAKMQRLEKYFKEGDVTASIVIRLNGPKEVIEVTIPGSKFTLRAEESSKDLYTSIDLVVDKLEGQIRKNKTKLNKKYKEVYNFQYAADEVDIEENNNKIVKRKELELKLMDEEEAILQMELLNHDFFIFKNDKNDEVSVIYRRKDGEYGIIDIK